MLNKKIALLLATTTLTLTGCVPSNAKDEANKYVTNYKDEFVEKVKATYGDKTSLNDIQGIIEQTKNTSTNKTVYHVTGDIKGELKINNKTYTAIYHPKTKKMESDIYVDEITNQLVNTLPFDTDSIVYDIITDKNGNTPMFDSTVISLDGAAVTTCDMYAYIVTKEDITRYTKEDLEAIDQLNRIAYGASNCKINIISITDEKELSSLKNNITECNFSSEKMPMTTSARTTFENYHISNSISIYFQNNNIKCQMLSLNGITP